MGNYSIAYTSTVIKNDWAASSLLLAAPPPPLLGNQPLIKPINARQQLLDRGDHLLQQWPDAGRPQTGEDPSKPVQGQALLAGVGNLMLSAKELRTILQKMGLGHAGELRRGAERRLEAVTAQLLDAKLRHSLSATTDLSELTATVLPDTSALSAAGAVVLDRFRYRLAHVAMRNHQWDMASALLDAVLEGTGELTRARLYRTVCKHRGEGRINDDALRELVQRYRQEGMERPGAPPLDVLVQEPTTCLLELLLLCQGGEPQLLDQLYEQQGHQRTTALTLFVMPQEGHPSTAVLSEWLAQAHLDEWGKEEWLVVDITVQQYGDLGRGSQLMNPNFPGKLNMAVLQVLAKAAVVGGVNNGLTPDAAKNRLHLLADGDLLESFNPDRWPYVTSGKLEDYPRRNVLKKNRLSQTWQLIPPYVVIQRDSATAMRQAAGNFQ
jgi:hypothetical protein